MSETLEFVPTDLPSFKFTSFDVRQIDESLATTMPATLNAESLKIALELPSELPYSFKDTQEIPSDSDVGGSGEEDDDVEGEEQNATQNGQPSGKLELSDQKDTGEQRILDEYRHVLETRTMFHFGYPYNLNYNHDELFGFMRYSINNLGDPFEPSNYAVHSRPFELAVLNFFARLWKIEQPNYWGYVTTSGTEGNLHGILMAREVLPEGILYTSKESHYSVFKAARFYRMDFRSIDTSENGQIDYIHLESQIAKNKDKPVIINANIGTTVKGAVDDILRILRILDSLGIPENKYYIHCDGALFALMMPFVKYSPEISFKLPIDSISVSGHKFLGCPMPCGVIVTRRNHVEKLASNIEYLNSRDTTIMGSRNGQAPLFMWYTLRKRGCHGLLDDVRKCLENARYLRDKLIEAGISVMLNDLSTTVVFERPSEERFVKKWQLACQANIAHVVVMPNVTKLKIDKFVNELSKSREEHKVDNICVKADIGKFCVCVKCGK